MTLPPGAIPPAYLVELHGARVGALHGEHHPIQPALLREHLAEHEQELAQALPPRPVLARDLRAARTRRMLMRALPRASVAVHDCSAASDR